VHDACSITRGLSPETMDCYSPKGYKQKRRVPRSIDEKARRRQLHERLSWRGDNCPQKRKIKQNEKEKKKIKEYKKKKKEKKNQKRKIKDKSLRLYLMSFYIYLYYVNYFSFAVKVPFYTFIYSY